MCMENRCMTKSKFMLSLLAITTKIIRSVFFNIFMLILGFVLGFGTLQTINYHIWKNNQNYECTKQLEEHLKQQRILDQKIDKEIKQIKIVMLENEANNH